MDISIDESPLLQDSIGSPRKLISIYEFYLGGISKRIEISIYQSIINGDLFFFRLSHYIKTPGQATEYRPSKDTAETPSEALYSAVRALMAYYSPAVAAGQSPEESWLVEA